MDRKLGTDMTESTARMDGFSVLIGGIAGDGINEAGLAISRLFSHLGYRIYMYYDYPSLIRGGHNFSIIRASRSSISAHSDRIDVLIALNQDTVETHRSRLKDVSFVIYDADKVLLDDTGLAGCGLPISSILKETGALPVMKNTAILGAFAKAVGIDWTALEGVLKKHIPKRLDQNLMVARRGYDQADPLCSLPKIMLGLSSQHQSLSQSLSQSLPQSLSQPASDLLGDKEAHAAPLPLLSGNQAIGLGLIAAGLGAYVAYPMTPSSSLLDFLARQAGQFGLQVIHPENEIAVMLMAQGFAYCGVRAAVGTSGGGFCLMAEGLSLSGMAEMPVVVVMSQRAGPSTGLPTYTAQSDLQFVASAGQGEFPRFIVAPGDAASAYYWSGVAMNLSWKYQIPSFILADKTLSEGQYSFDRSAAGEVGEAAPLLWNGQGRYLRYKYAEDGVSPMAFPPIKGQAVKTDSYMHDEMGITTEDALVTRQMTDKRLQKGISLVRDLEGYETVLKFSPGAVRSSSPSLSSSPSSPSSGSPSSASPSSPSPLSSSSLSSSQSDRIALLCWGSNQGVCREAAEILGLSVISVLVLAPFPLKNLRRALQGLDKLIAVECNATGQLAALVESFGIPVSKRILKYDGRPFSIEDLLLELGRVLS